mmetsp:Transcript_5971/g.14474  ORF Transcript_5971/g.14474 Transcript_5971/m.14474 type:complete len:616 (+) Transcript_5971:158-2005(+)
MPLKAQSVQSTGDLVLVRIYNPGNQGVDHTTDLISEGENDAEKSIERLSSDEVSSWAMTTARMLQEQWPRQDRDKQQISESELGNTIGNAESNQSVDEEDNAEYYRKFLVHHDKSCPRYSLSCSYILLEENPNIPTKPLVVGHGRLTECYESAGGNAVAATYILVDPKHRGKGYGRTLLGLLEREAKSKERLGCDYHFVYLWCKATTAPFYEKSSYLPSKNRVSLQRPCLKALTASSVQSLEDVLLHRRRHQNNNEPNASDSAMANDNSAVKNTTKKLETIMLLPSKSEKTNSDNGGEQPVAEDDVWLRKRLVDHVESTIVSEQDRRNELEQFVASRNNTKVVSTNHSTNTIVAGQEDSKCWYQYHWNPHVPWQMQIGPTCGLTAVRMIRDFYCAVNPENKNQAQNEHSLLTEAQNRGYTDDGEMFDADQLRVLTKDQLLMVSTDSSSLSDTATSSRSIGSFEVETRETSSLTFEEIDYTIRNGGLWILPYDSNPRTKLPGKFRGIHAHWGVIVGVLYARTPQPQSASAADTPEEGIVDVDVLGEDQSLSPENAPVGGSLYLIVQHSLSSKWAIAPVEHWFDSNCQLMSVNEHKFVLGNEKDLNLNNKVIKVTPT